MQRRRQAPTGSPTRTSSPTACRSRSCGRSTTTGRDWLYVDDDAEAIEAIIAAPLDVVAGEVLNVATGIDISIDEVADLVLELVGKPASLKTHVPERPGQVDRHIGSTEKIRRLCGWSARTSFEEGLARTVAWYRENEAWWRTTERPKAKLSSS